MTARACANLRFFVSLLQRLSPHGWLDMMLCVVALRSTIAPMESQNLRQQSSSAATRCVRAPYQAWPTGDGCDAEQPGLGHLLVALFTSQVN